ncbi:hypothetical protein V8F20_001271 [Naviculisporaceae sp. PSN 640]
MDTQSKWPPRGFSQPWKSHFPDDMETPSRWPPGAFSQPWRSHSPPKPPAENQSEQPDGGSFQSLFQSPERGPQPSRSSAQPHCVLQPIFPDSPAQDRADSGTSQPLIQPPQPGPQPSLPPARPACAPRPVMPPSPPRNRAAGYFPPQGHFANPMPKQTQKRKQPGASDPIRPEGDNVDSRPGPNGTRGPDAPAWSYFPTPNSNTGTPHVTDMGDSGTTDPPTGVPSAAAPLPTSNEDSSQKRMGKQPVDNGHDGNITETITIPIFKGKTVLRGEARRQLGVGKKVRGEKRLSLRKRGVSPTERLLNVEYFLARPMVASSGHSQPEHQDETQDTRRDDPQEAENGPDMDNGDGNNATDPRG